jgi:hypothetical protein
VGPHAHPASTCRPLVTQDVPLQAQEAVAKQARAAAEEVRLETTPAHRLHLLRTVVGLLHDDETPMMVCARARPVPYPRAPLPSLLDGHRGEGRARTQALARLGPKRTSAAAGGRGRAAPPAAPSTSSKADFEALTEACDELMGLGEYGIYQEPRARLQTQLPADDAAGAAGGGAVQWRYKWAPEGDVFGPFSSEQMAAWAAQVRPVRTTHPPCARPHALG